MRNNRKIKLFFTILFCFLITTSAHAKHLYPEKYYQQNWCRENKGISEVKLSDNTRIDCLTDEYAIEFDFASKWAEAIGQSLHYSYMTNKKAGIVLIVENDDDVKYVDRIKPLCEKHNITLWQTHPPKKENEYTTKFYNLEEIIELLLNVIKELLKLFSNL